MQPPIDCSRRVVWCVVSLLVGTFVLLFAPSKAAAGDLIPSSEVLRLYKLAGATGAPTRRGGIDFSYVVTLPDGRPAYLTRRKFDVLGPTLTLEKAGLFAPIYGHAYEENHVFLVMRDLNFTRSGLPPIVSNNFQRPHVFAGLPEGAKVALLEGALDKLPYHFTDGHPRNVVGLAKHTASGIQVETFLVDPPARIRTAEEQLALFEGEISSNVYVREVDPRWQAEYLAGEMGVAVPKEHPALRRLRSRRAFLFVPGWARPPIASPDVFIPTVVAEEGMFPLSAAGRLVMGAALLGDMVGSGYIDPRSERFMEHWKYGEHVDWESRRPFEVASHNLFGTSVIPYEEKKPFEIPLGTPGWGTNPNYRPDPNAMSSWMGVRHWFADLMYSVGLW